MKRSSARLLVARSIRFVVLLLLVASAATPDAGAQTADTIIHHAKIYTVNAKQPWAEALAIHGDKIIAVGTQAEVEKLAIQKRKRSTPTDSSYCRVSSIVTFIFSTARSASGA
jgi:hypothetical protein